MTGKKNNLLQKNTSKEECMKVQDSILLFYMLASFHSSIKNFLYKVYLQI
jgi:hypothetical protein